MRGSLIVAAGVGLGLAAAGAHGAASDTAPMMTYLGLPQLIQQYGANLATGSNVNVSIAESVFGGAYYPSLGDGRFAGKTLTPTSTFTASGSSHATNVGARFFGNETGSSQRSVAPNIPNVQLYSYSEFNGLYLKTPGAFPTPEPYGSPNQSRVSSHAYGDNDTSIGAITRLDYLVQRDDFLHVVDTRQFSTQGNSLNSIVSAPAGGTTTLTTAVGTGTPYVAGRTSPSITGPLVGAGSDSIGQVAGVVALLVSRGKTTASNHSYTTRATNYVVAPYSGTFTTATQGGYTVRSGDTSEVVKAALMAGAHRNIAADGAAGVPAISDYRASAANQSANGLDTRYGAGMVSAVNSYRIIDAGERDSAEDGASGGIGQYGFDYDPAFGGAGANAAATYAFTADASGKFYATLAWNVKIAGASTTGGLFDSTATLYNLGLTLTDVTGGGSSVVQQSASPVDNTQSLWTDLAAGHTYHLTVSALGAPFNWDYGLAWRSDVPLTPTTVPEPAAAALLLGAAALCLNRRRR